MQNVKEELEVDEVVPVVCRVADPASVILIHFPKGLIESHYKFFFKVIGSKFL